MVLTSWMHGMKKVIKAGWSRKCLEPPFLPPEEKYEIRFSQIILSLKKSLILSVVK